MMSDTVSPPPSSDDAPARSDRLAASANAVATGGCVGREASVLEGAFREVADLCQRTRRTAQMAQRALLPLELHAEFGLTTA